ncbi:MAG: Eco57I restriction-modification methylase domain-containing protein [Campylobacterota bacterium]|nr:Eco57I restriction-modification methylase domain-containing protein [Campylobacterota bacterium]
MNIENFLQSGYKKENFIEFIYSKFQGFEENDIDYEVPTEQKDIQKYKFLGQVELTDGKELGFFEFVANETKDIENNRVSFNKFLQKRVDEEFLDGAIAVFYNPAKLDVWRLSFLQFGYDENNKQTVTNLKRYTYVLGENIPTKTAEEQLKDLKQYPTLNQLQTAFSVEKVSKEFFTKYKELYHKLVKDIMVVNEEKITAKENEILNDEKLVSFYIKKLLGRIVFLYFVQKKGWLDGEKKFLSKLFFDYTNKNPDTNFYDEILESLFFSGLNEDRKGKKLSLGDCEYSIPYLNGGLFESDHLDNENLTIPNKDLQQVLELFDSYNFTVIEDTPHDSEVAIDPEMLGRVFEDLLEDRKDKGAFYTPREIVHYMCQKSIINYLSNIFDDEDAIKELVLNQKTDNNYIRKNAKTIQESLSNIKVLDPAIGSGAYPMGMLHEIVQVLSNIDKSADIAKLKRQVIENSIYGVDIEHSAVEIAKLRFWLSIVVDEEKPTPLPNLAYKIMVGNSLLETVNGFDPLKLHGNTKEMKFLKEKLHRYFNTSDNKEKKKINGEIKRNTVTVLQSASKSLNIQPKFEMNKKETKELEENTQRYNLLKSILKDYEKDNYTTKLFLYKIYFKEVLDDGGFQETSASPNASAGFDVVIGNPPYVRQEKIKELKSKKEIQDFKSYCGTADLYIYFFEKGYKLLKENGVLSYITSNKYTRAKYGKEFRKFVLENTAIKEYIDFNGVKVFESATVDTSILTYKKAKIKDASFIYCDIDAKYKKGQELEKFIDAKGFEYSQNDLNVDSFSFSSPAELRIKKQIEKIGTPLKEWDVKINYGIKTGLLNAFIIDTKIKDELISIDSNCKDIIKPFLRGRDISNYTYNYNELWLINFHNNPPLDINDFPSIKNHLDKFYDKLKKRTDQGNTPYNLRTCSYLEKFEKEKILFPDIASKASFYLDKNNFYIETSSFIMYGSNLKYLVAFLNSKLITFIYKKFYMGSDIGKSIRYKKAFLSLLPIPQVSKEQQKPFEILVDYILFAKEQDMKMEASLFESVIDGMVYDLYFEEDMKKADCFISDEVTKVIKEFDNTSDMIHEMYKIFKDNKTIQRGLIYSRVVGVVKVINGDNK